MKRFFRWLKNLFFPPPHSTVFRRILPFAVVAVLLLVIFVASMAVWEGTNTTVFCGTTCHTMPPQYVTQQLSPHASITCEDCHLGRTNIFESIVRKAQYSWQTGTAMILNTYKYPIIAKNMRPASQACLPCHNPEKVSGDKLIEIKEFAQDEVNTATSIFLIMKTEGGTQRAGLGYGIHWHIENPVYYYATDALQQNIPYIMVKMPDGTTKEYIDSETLVDPSTIDPSKLQKMDCITCHNRVVHGIQSPEDAVNDMVSRGLVSQTIPNIVKVSNAVLNAKYSNMQQADLAITGIYTYYQQFFADYYAKNMALIGTSVENLRTWYHESEWFDQKMDWTTHPNNIGHEESAGCFRCHDGKHITTSGDAIRLECNLCHSIPAVAGAAALETDIQVSKGIEPASHKNTNWITLHNEAFDETCSGCHTVSDPGGTSNTSFCSNSECHGGPWTYAGFDAPKLRQVLKDQLPKVLNTPTAPPAPAPTTAPSQPVGNLTYADIAPLFKKCTMCHTAGGSASLDLTTYQGIMTGGKNGPAVVPGDPQNSLLVQKQSGTSPHYGQFSNDELNQIIRWIQGGALEK